MKLKNILSESLNCGREAKFGSEKFDRIKVKNPLINRLNNSIKKLVGMPLDFPISTSSIIVSGMTTHSILERTPYIKSGHVRVKQKDEGLLVEAVSLDIRDKTSGLDYETSSSAHIRFSIPYSLNEGLK